MRRSFNRKVHQHAEDETQGCIISYVNKITFFHFPPEQYVNTKFNSFTEQIEGNRFTTDGKHFTVVYVFSLVTSNPRLDKPSSAANTT